MRAQTRRAAMADLLLAWLSRPAPIAQAASGLTATIGIAAALLLAQAAAAQNVLVNPDFEGTAPGLDVPNVTGVWSGDVTTLVVGAENGISPQSGSQMVRCDATLPTGGGGTSGCQLWQVYDVSALAADIAAGNVTVQVSLHVNRVVGDIETDTR